jgi:cysteine desulfurase family protein
MDRTDTGGAEPVSGPCTYLDHAATSWPKPPEVIAAVVAAMQEQGANPGRGAYGMALAASRLVHESRKSVARLLGVPDPRDVFFTSGCTESCNVMLKGVLSPGDRVVVSSMEHNSVSRPLYALAARGVRVDVVAAGPTGLVDPTDVEAVVREMPTRAVVCLHASNVTGTIQPIADLAGIAHEQGALLLVDGAQGAGHLDVDLVALDVDAYAASGHKGMLGPQGVGLLYVRPGLEVLELMQGGTGGGSSGSDEQPSSRPEHFEAGTPNTPGIAGLGAGADLLMLHGGAWRAEEQRLYRALKAGLASIPGVTVYGPALDEPCVPVVSITSDRLDPDRIASALDARACVAVRSGLHCAPWAHRTLGTLETGSVRLSVGHGTTDDGIERTLAALAQMLA